MEPEKSVGLTTEEFNAARNAVRERLSRVCAEQTSIGVRNPVGILTELRIKTEMLSIDINTLVIALVSTGAIDESKFMMTALQLMQKRVEELQETQSKIVLANGRLSS